MTVEIHTYIIGHYHHIHIKQVSPDLHKQGDLAGDTVPRRINHTPVCQSSSQVLRRGKWTQVEEYGPDLLSFPLRLNLFQKGI